MLEPTSDKNYEEKFEFPLWKLIKQRAEEKDISYMAAGEEVVPEYMKTIRYQDKDFEEAEIAKRRDEVAATNLHYQQAKQAKEKANECK
jgi:hypothetical protein